MVKKNEQAKAHVESKHSAKKFEECFPGFTCGSDCGSLWFCLKLEIDKT